MSGGTLNGHFPKRLGFHVFATDEVLKRQLPPPIGEEFCDRRFIKEPLGLPVDHEEVGFDLRVPARTEVVIFGRVQATEQQTSGSQCLSNSLDD